ncbi:MAG TPA: twin-arginine translocase subunit TatC [Gemmatimonadales bacterium]|nr:twin-arginine translocase subunit TatC [Gemmatimonadales bacterium]
MAERPDRGEMPFLDHLEELRWRLLKSLLAVALGTAAGWFVVQHFDLLELLKRPIAPYLPDGRLVFTSPTEPLMLTLKLAFVAGLVLASPVVIYQAWAFLAPALYEREKRVIVPAFAAGIVLFLAGALACYLWVLPAAVRVLFGFQTEQLTPMITVGSYFGFAIRLLAAFGTVAELPLVVTILAAFGLVTPQFLIRHRRYAIVISAVVAAFLTPPDALSMMLMLVPMLLLYEVSILCAWLMARRRARAAAAARTAVLLLLLGLVGGDLAAQGGRPAGPARDTSRAGDTPRVRNRPVDTAAARRLGLPPGPTRSFPQADAVMDSLLKLAGYRVTRYVADSAAMQGDSQVIVLRGQAYVEREQTKLEADSVRYHQAACRLDAAGDPRLFDQGTVLVGDRMRYDTCNRRGTVLDALTDFEQGGATWYMRGNLAVDSGSTRLYGASSAVTTCDLPVPHYHFAAREVKWINQNVMVARPAVLYIRDVPILWLPFIFQDIRSGRRSGILVPRFGLNDLIRPSRSYQRHVANVGYYFALSDYADLLLSADWYSGRSLTFRAQSRYRWLDRFVSGSIGYSRLEQLDAQASSSQITWQHQQAFDSRTQFNASVNYATSARVIPRNTVDPYYATAQLTSNLGFSKRFSWGTLSLGGSRTQNLQNDQVSQTFPNVSLTPAPVNLASWATWSPGFSLRTTRNLKNGPTLVPIPGDTAPDTLRHFFDTRQTDLSFATPLRLGRWNWSNSFAVTDVRSTERREFLIPDSTAPGGVRRVLYGETFQTGVDWQTGINLPQLLGGTWKLQPGIAIVNTTGAGPFMVRNQFSGGKFVQQGKRLQFSASVRPTLFGFFPGVGPLQRVRHSVAPIVNYRYAPAARVPEEYARALDPTGRQLNVRSDPQQTIDFGLSQNFEAKLRPPPGDTAAEARKVRLLSISTSSIAYNFEQAKQPGRTGWQTQALTNTFASDLLPGFSLRITHDLWDGPVGFDTTRFDPFLQSMDASFSVTPATLRGVAALLGFRPGRSPERPAAAPADTAASAPGTPPRPGGLLGGAIIPGPRPYGAGGRGFSLAVTYSSTRTRRPPGSAIAAPRGGQQVLNLNLSFSPTPNWQATWTTSYDVDTRQFGQHVVQFQRDLHRWQASFGFWKSATGSFAFNFYVSLRDQPDIRFDYEQQSLPR